MQDNTLGAAVSALKNPGSSVPSLDSVSGLAHIMELVQIFEECDSVNQLWQLQFQSNKAGALRAGSHQICILNTSKPDHRADGATNKKNQKTQSVNRIRPLV